MGPQANWVSEGPDTMQLEAVLSSGLHDGLHEDEIEDLKGRGVSVPRKTVVRSDPAIGQLAAPELGKLNSNDAKSWFAQHYPKLQPQDLAEFYRESYQAPEPPVRSGSVDAFDTYRRLLAAHVKNANINEDVEPASKPEPGSNNLRIAPEMLAHHRAVSISRRDNGLPRTSIIALLTFFSLVFGGFVGKGIANSDDLVKFVSIENAVTRLQTLLPTVLRQ